MTAAGQVPSPCCPRLTRLLLPPTPPLSPPPTLPPAPKPASFQSLPTEILSIVLTHLSPPSLAASASTATFILPLARGQLYRTLSLRNQRHGRAAPSGSSALDKRSTRLLSTLTSHPSLSSLATELDFDLLSHLTFDEIAELLADIFALCPALSSLRLGPGAHGHGIGFKPLRDALSLSPSAARNLRTLDVESCNGAPHTLAAVLVQLEALQELRVGQFLLEKGDYAGPAGPKCRLKTLIAQRGRITPLAFSFATSSSANSLKTASLPICERTTLDLSPFHSLTSLTLFVFLSSPSPGLCPSHPSFDKTLSRLSRNFCSTLESVDYLSSLTLKGSWDAPPTPSPVFSGTGGTVPSSALGAGLVGGLTAGQPIDLVFHARLLQMLPSSLSALSIRTELNSLALAAWLTDQGWWEGRSAEMRLQVWQKTSYSEQRREFQKRVRERVEEAASGREGTRIEWMRYEQW
ncbi:hypothetical protein JCM11641_007985 [Rhodosporidiobolus odoratus]